MIYLLPFFTTFLMYIISVAGQPLNKPYVFIAKKIEDIIATHPNKFVNNLFQLIYKAIGGCSFCFAAQIGLWTLVFIYSVKIYYFDFAVSFSGYWLLKEVGHFIFLVAYNAVSSVFLFKQSLQMPSQAPPRHVPVPIKKLKTDENN